MREVAYTDKLLNTLSQGLLIANADDFRGRFRSWTYMGKGQRQVCGHEFAWYNDSDHTSLLVIGNVLLEPFPSP